MGQRYTNSRGRSRHMRHYRRRRNRRMIIPAIILIVLAIAAVAALIFSSVDRSSQAAETSSPSVEPIESQAEASTEPADTAVPVSGGAPIGSAIDSLTPAQLITSLTVNGQEVALDDDAAEATIDLGKTATWGEVAVEVPQGITVVSGQGTHRLVRGDNIVKIQVSDGGENVREISLNIKRGEAISFEPKSVFYTDGSMVALTMDDGTPSANVEKALDIFKKYDVKCTFFVCGDYMKSAPEVWQRAVAEGHEVAWHSMHHDNMLDKGPDYLLKDIEEWENLAHEILGDDYVIPAFLRLPYGAGQSVEKIQNVLKKKGYRSIYWSVDPLTECKELDSYDASVGRTSQNFYEVIKKKTNESSIILLHFKDIDYGALELSIDYLTSNFKLGRISDFLD